MKSNAPLDWLLGSLSALVFVGVIAGVATFLNLHPPKPPPGWLDRLAPRRLRLVGAIVLGVLVLLLPTLLGLFTGLAHLSLSYRVLTFAGWLVVAAVVGLVTARADDHMHSLLGRPTLIAFRRTDKEQRDRLAARAERSERAQAVQQSLREERRERDREAAH